MNNTDWYPTRNQYKAAKKSLLTFRIVLSHHKTFQSHKNIPNPFILLSEVTQVNVVHQKMNFNLLIVIVL